MRYKDSVEQQSYLKHASDQGNLELVYAGLDVLGSTPWMINDKIFHTVLKVWNSGQRLGKVPPVVYDVAEPEPPSNPSDVREKTLYAARVKEWNHGKANNHSDRCNVNYKIEIARAVRAYLLRITNVSLTSFHSSLGIRFTSLIMLTSVVVLILFLLT